MALEKKLDCVILGLLSHEELTGYEIKKRIDTTLKYFWNASYGSIYPTLKELTDRGMVMKREEADGGRKRILYTIMEEGREFLREWLEVPAVRDEVRYETLLKLFFGSEAGPETALEHLALFREKTQRELAHLRQAEQTLENVKDEEVAHRYFLVTVKFGIRTYEAYLQWCQEAEQMLDGKGC